MSEATFDPTVAGVLVPADRPFARSARPHRRIMSREEALRALPRGDLSEAQQAGRWRAARRIVTVPANLLFRVRLEHPERILAGPAVYCFNHLGWMDPMAIITAFPKYPRLYFYGPQQADIQHGRRNRIMWWSAICIPFRPAKDDLRATMRQVHAVFDSGGILAISGEGEIHVHEGDLLPFHDGAAYIALRAGVPIVPVAVTGTSWAHFRGEVRVRVGEAIETNGERPTRERIAEYTARAWHAVHAMVEDDRDLPKPGPIERWFTDLFNDWGPGGRAVASMRRGARPDDIPIPPEQGRAAGARR